MRSAKLAGGRSRRCSGLLRSISQNGWLHLDKGSSPVPLRRHDMHWCGNYTGSPRHRGRGEYLRCSDRVDAECMCFRYRKRHVSRGWAKAHLHGGVVGVQPRPPVSGVDTPRPGRCPRRGMLCRLPAEHQAAGHHRVDVDLHPRSVGVITPDGVEVRQVRLGLGSPVQCVHLAVGGDRHPLAAGA